MAETTDEDKITYYQSVIIAQTAVLKLMNRYEKLCLEQAAAAEGSRKAELEQK